MSDGIKKAQGVGVDASVPRQSNFPPPEEDIGARSGNNVYQLRPQGRQMPASAPRRIIPSWFPGPQSDWDVFKKNATPDILAKLDAGKVVYDEYWAERFLGMPSDQGELLSNLAAAERLYHRQPMLFHPEAVARIHDLKRLFAIADDEAHPFLVSVSREGKNPISVPTVGSLLSGYVVGGNMRRFLKSVRDDWFGGDIGSLAGEIGADSEQLRNFLDGSAKLKRYPNTYPELTSMAAKLGVDPRRLDVAWFADESWSPMFNLRHGGKGDDPRILRAQVLMSMATVRSGVKAIPVQRAASVESMIGLVLITMNAGFHPKTAISVLSDLSSRNEYFYDSAMAYCEKMGLGGQQLHAAMVCYLASHHYRVWGSPTRVIKLILQGNAHLNSYVQVMKGQLSPEKLEQFSHTQLLYSKEACVLNERLQEATRGRVKEAVPAFVIDSVGFAASMAAMSAPRQRAIAEISNTQVWKTLEYAERFDIVRRAFAAVDPERSAAVSPAVLHVALYGAAVASGLIATPQSSQDIDDGRLNEEEPVVRTDRRIEDTAEAQESGSSVESAMPEEGFGAATGISPEGAIPGSVVAAAR